MATETGLDDELPKLPFVTTSDVLNQLNKNLKELSVPGEESFEPRVDFHKRLPDGSTIPASQEELAYSDMQTKLQQSAAFVAQLSSPEDKQIWAEEQRKTANAYFRRGDYKTAMDVYLTCLVVKEEDSLDFLRETLIPVLNNLAQCTLQLGMHKKTIMFCNIALEEMNKFDNKHDDGDNGYNIAMCKLYFKRAKAKRLKGDYGSARDDLNQSQEYCNFAGKQKEENDKAAVTTSVEPYQKAIQKEFRHLEMAEKEARRNRQRQKQAMQKVLSSNNSSTTTTTRTTTPTPLYGQDECSTKNVRQYSTLRRKPPKSTPSEASDVSQPTELSYWEYYCLVVARVAETLLIWLGDEETKERLRLQEENPTAAHGEEKAKDE